MGLAIPPKPAVAAGSRVLPGQRALAMARRGPETERHCTGEHFWARGSAVATGGVALASGKKSSREPEKADQAGRFSRSLCGSLTQQTARLRAVL